MDDRLRALRAFAAEWATDLRAIALDLDRDPDAVHRVLELPVMTYLATARHTEAPDSEPLVVGRYSYRLDTVLEQVVFFEELARGDVGAVLAAPGAPMAGPLVDLLGDDDQREWFFGRLHKQATWVFFALTEPGHGSDAGGIETELRSNGGGFHLSGAKRYIGNAPRSQLGVVFARERPGPLGVRAVVIEAPSPGLTITGLDTIGLRGAALGALEMESVPVPADRVLGRHLPATRRGAASWVRVFNRLRPRVAALGVGLARAAYDYTIAQIRHRHDLDDLRERIEAARWLNLRAAAAVDADPTDDRLPSAAKARAARLAEEVTLACLDYLGPGARFDHPLLGKLARDARGVEFMEGAGNVQKLIVGHHLTRGGIHHG